MSLTPYIDDGDQVIYPGDCIDVMRELPAESVSVIITDPPYGLEFMGHKWDAFRRDDPGTGRNRGDRAGKHGELVGPQTDRPGTVGYGGGKRATTSRCTTCGKRDQYRNAHEPCGPGDWRTEIIDPYSAPPTMLAFQEWTRTWAVEALRVLKPGAHLLAFGGTRTYHRLAAGLEDAGFEIRDCLTWLYGQGYPKSLDVSKAIDKEAGAKREQVPATGGLHNNRNLNDDGWRKIGDPNATMDAPDPITADAAAWHGWGTALKPAWEPIILARKPFATSVAKNVLEHGTGALNVKGARIAVDPRDPVNDAVWTSRPSNFRDGTTGFVTSNSDGERRSAAPPEGGRWPANLVLDSDAADQLDASTDGTPDGHWPASRPRNTFGFGHTGQGELDEATAAGERTGVSRFFYTAKASTSERNHGLHGLLPTAETDAAAIRPRARECTICGSRSKRPGRPYPACGHENWRHVEHHATTDRGRAKGTLHNHHPTVKPLALMRWLVRLATPPGGVLLDPFLGSGTTLLAARREGVRGIGIELDPDYLPIAAGRLAQLSLFALDEEAT